MDDFYACNRSPIPSNHILLDLFLPVSGQYTNLLYQSSQLGLTGQWSAVKESYAVANRLLGDIIKVTPSSKVVGDMAQFLVANNLTEQEVIDQAETLSFPKSVIEYFQGYLGIPPFGFPEPLRSRVVKGQTIPGTNMSCFSGRPGADMPPMDLAAEKKKLEEKWGPGSPNDSHNHVIRDVDVMSHAMYPAVYDGEKRNYWHLFMSMLCMLSFNAHAFPFISFICILYC